MNSTTTDSRHDSTAELCSTIEVVRERLRKHEKYIGEKETRTRVLIIDELLRALGWDVTDPGVVQMELGNNGSAIDYVLCLEQGERFAVVEAKRSKEGLNSEHRRQASGYAVELGVGVVILTNGGRWEAWALCPGTARRDAMILETNVATGEADKVAADMMSIHRQRLLHKDGRQDH